MRQGHFGDLRAHFLKLLDAFVEAGHDARLEAFAEGFGPQKGDPTMKKHG